MEEEEGTMFRLGRQLRSVGVKLEEPQVGPSLPLVKEGLSSCEGESSANCLSLERFKFVQTKDY